MKPGAPHGGKLSVNRDSRPKEPTVSCTSPLSPAGFDPVEPRLIEPRLIEPRLVEPRPVEPDRVEAHRVEPHRAESRYLSPTPSGVIRAESESIDAVAVAPLPGHAARRADDPADADFRCARRVADLRWGMADSAPTAAANPPVPPASPSVGAFAATPTPPPNAAPESGCFACLARVWRARWSRWRYLLFGDARASRLDETDSEDEFRRWADSFSGVRCDDDSERR